MAVETKWPNWRTSPTRRHWRRRNVRTGGGGFFLGGGGKKKPAGAAFHPAFVSHDPATHTPPHPTTPPKKKTNETPAASRSVRVFKTNSLSYRFPDAPTSQKSEAITASYLCFSGPVAGVWKIGSSRFSSSRMMVRSFGTGWIGGMGSYLT